MRAQAALGIGALLLSLAGAGCGGNSSVPTTTAPQLLGVVTGYAALRI